ncbi:M1-specific T cell receptor alpha chain-like isoform X2 [Hypomesus transpacificus]|uniref:M1-specific T cell receptor alpha chain-like isoform X2 n=1 Tax=Hypomesus transpacificus TaxID=137520 RepID=UPI001F08615F|nr:M1-specific T cell receptor alpha chain-like isoform X2 [Hypomesus transpacificus]
MDAYCATGDAGGRKLIYGKGTRLHVESRESKEPSYYQLKNNETTACLATDFSSFNSTQVDTSIFNNEATRMKEDPYYSQVALNKKCPYNNNQTCTADGIESDGKTRFLSLTILGLRILFVKTIIFNVLMTLRVWMS